MAKPNKTKAHHSFLRNDALGCNVDRFQKSGKGLKENLQISCSKYKSFSPPQKKFEITSGYTKIDTIDITIATIDRAIRTRFSFA